MQTKVQTAARTKAARAVTAVGVRHQDAQGREQRALPEALLGAPLSVPRQALELLQELAPVQLGEPSEAVSLVQLRKYYQDDTSG